jgi:hypothetical protein
MSEPKNDERLASGWGRRQPKQSGRDWSGSEMSEQDQIEPAEDLGLAGDAGPITGRASTRTPQQLATGDTLGGARDTDTADDTGPADESEANLAQSDPLQDQPSRH